ncbi:transposase (plasmid) [Cupriavidus basilensis]|uniref:Transposase n=1 Tax=Cupriavidus basilensis TaxID=68895 RepID=A0A643FLC0_9BURK|nr:transposase [Cupriavidus basilensis]
MVARQHGVYPNQLFHWRKLNQDGSLSAVSGGDEVVPASELSDALRQVRELQRLLGKKTMESEIPREAVEVMKCENGLRAHPHCRGRPVKGVCEVLGVARPNVAEKLARPAGWQDGRYARKTDDAGLIEAIRDAVAHLPSYGYRRVWGVLRREQARKSAPPVNVKRDYRVMRVYGLLLQRRVAPPRPQRRHEGKVTVAKTNQRWWSYGFELR